MANIFDYLKDVAYDSFYDFPLNELDILSLTESTYLSFDNLRSVLILCGDQVHQMYKLLRFDFASFAQFG